MFGGGWSGGRYPSFFSIVYYILRSDLRSKFKPVYVNVCGMAIIRIDHFNKTVTVTN